MGRHGARAAAPPSPWYALLGRAVLRWTGRLALGLLAGGVVLGATVWAGTSFEAARALAAAAAVVAVVASTLAATLPPAQQPPTTSSDEDHETRHDPARGDR